MYDRIPAWMLSDLLEYAIEGRKLGGHFLTAVLRGKLHAAVRHADTTSRAALCQLCDWMFNRMPQTCYGDDLAYNKWIGLKNMVPDTLTNREEIAAWRAKAIEGTVLDERQ